MTQDKGASATADRAAGLRPQPPAESSQSSIPGAGDQLLWFREDRVWAALDFALHAAIRNGGQAAKSVAWDVRAQFRRALLPASGMSAGTAETQSGSGPQDRQPDPQSGDAQHG